MVSAESKRLLDLRSRKVWVANVVEFYFAGGISARGFILALKRGKVNS